MNGFLGSEPELEMSDLHPAHPVHPVHHVHQLHQLHQLHERRGPLDLHFWVI